MLVVIAVVASLIVGDQRSSAADLPRFDVAARDALNAIASLLPPSDRIARGQRLYQSNCASCHGGSQGGNASDYPPRHNAVGHTWQHADCDLEQIVRNGPAPSEAGRFFAPGLQMPAFRDRLTDDEIGDVLAYIKTFWTDDQRAAQAATTARVC